MYVKRNTDIGWTVVRFFRVFQEPGTVPLCSSQSSRSFKRWKSVSPVFRAQDEIEKNHTAQTQTIAERPRLFPEKERKKERKNGEKAPWRRHTKQQATNHNSRSRRPGCTDQCVPCLPDPSLLRDHSGVPVHGHQGIWRLPHSHSQSLAFCFHQPDQGPNRSIASFNKHSLRANKQRAKPDIKLAPTTTELQQR